MRVWSEIYEGLRISLSAVLANKLRSALTTIGLRAVSGLTPHHEQYVAWCWVVNGFCSVVASVLATILAMTTGFDTVILVGLCCYLVGITAFLRVPAAAARAS